MANRVQKVISHILPEETMAEQTSVGFEDDDVVILSAARTPMGAYGGALSSLSAPQLAAVAMRGALTRSGVPPEAVNEVYMGCALQGGVGQNPARQALIGAGIPDTCPATTVNKVCASGMKALAIGMGTIKMGYNEVVVCGGMESMSNVPHYLKKLRFGNKFGHEQMEDGMLSDGLTDCYNDCHMGSLAELCADTYEISREDQDAFALESFNRAQASAEHAQAEIIPVSIPQRRGDPVDVISDEPVSKVNIARMPKLRPAFPKLDGSKNADRSVTAANASSLADGAAALVICSGAKARELGLSPIARVLSYADAAQDPKFFTTAPALAVPLALQRAGLSVEDLGPDDYIELNEAFSVVGVACMQLLGVNPQNTNVFGGGVSMGHPLGCSGARILCTLLNVLTQRGGRYGVAGICNGGGGATACVLEKL